MQAKPTKAQHICEQCGTVFVAWLIAQRRFCSHACADTWRRRPLAERFWEKVNRNGPIPAQCPDLGPCWVWTASRGGRGYGKFGTGRGGWQTASRVSWEIAHGPIPAEMWVLHRCDNPPCVNPGHLFLGTPTTNVRDMVAKDRNGKRGGRASRFSNADKRSIAERFIRGTTQAELAKELGVTQGRISQIIIEVRKAGS